ncbi:MAG: nucleotidyltransferase domain-containing protein [Balneolaceae bacterium]
MSLKAEIKNRSISFYNLCAKHKVKYLYAFGSSITNRFDEEKSDIDLLVEINERDPLHKGELLLSFWDELEKFFNRKVDLLTESSLSNPYLKKSVDSTKELIYEESTEKIPI